MCLVFIYFTAFSVSGIQTLPIVNLCITLCMWTTYTITELCKYVNFLFRWMHMLVYCSSALFNKLMFWGLYWHLTAWLELMWLNSWKNTMGYLSALPEITVGEEGLINTWADLYSVVQLFQWNAHKTTFEAWGLLTLPEQAQIVWADIRAFLCVWKALVSCRVWSRGSFLELCFQERDACVCKLGSCVKPRVKPLFF